MDQTPFWKDACRKKFLDPSQIESACFSLKKTGMRLATLNGSFDLMHAGHLHIIYEASKQADILIVALNTDRSIQEYKNKDRPIIPLESRLEMMSALEFVDYVTWFDETTPLAILEKIRPHVHVNGAEYGENCIEAETVKKYGGKVHIVPLIPGLSTSMILKKVATVCV